MRRATTRAAAALAAACLLAGCGGSGGRAETAAVRDSAGIRVVESAAPAWGEGEGWRLSPEPVRWTVFDPEGRQLGTPQLPPRFRFTDVGADYVLGVAQDDLDVQQVQMYRLDRRGR